MLVVSRTCSGGHSERETPGPIPNPEVKPPSADGTAHASVWESKTPPEHHHHSPPGKHTTPPGGTPIYADVKVQLSWCELIFGVRTPRGVVKPDLAHLVSFPGVVDGVEPGLDVVGDGVFSGDDGVAGLDVDGSVAA